jgi:hypothetical protein
MLSGLEEQNASNTVELTHRPIHHPTSPSGDDKLGFSDTSDFCSKADSFDGLGLQNRHE